ncbi:MAG: hypothetical protein NZ990_14610 [Myxococcota bacterium]|nr:hypothetical protein [Myxococcota bacterium]
MGWILEPTNHPAGQGWTRRGLMKGALAGAASLFVLARPRGAESEAAAAFALPEAALKALETSSLVYISPLLADGSESQCHGEVWYFSDRGSVVIVTAADGWKARAIRRGRDRARIWVGDFGRVGLSLGRFRKAPTFVTRAEIVSDRAAFDRLMDAFGERYPDEWAKWQPRFEKGFGDGSRVLIRYSPVSA